MKQKHKWTYIQYVRGISYVLHTIIRHLKNKGNDNLKNNNKNKI